jgi:uncharacterized lipoprotein YajG
MHIKFLALVVSILILSSCAQQPPPQIVKQPYQRFVPVPRQPADLMGLPWSGAFALDTKSGQLCWTYDVKNSSQSDMWPVLPYCSALRTLYPD